MSTQTVQNNPIYVPKYEGSVPTQTDNKLNVVQNNLREVVQHQGVEGVKDIKLPPLNELNVEVVDTGKTAAKNESLFAKARAFVSKMIDNIVSLFVSSPEEKLAKAERKQERQAEALVDSNMEAVTKNKNLKLRDTDPIGNFVTLKANYDERTALRGIDTVVDAAVHAHKVVAGQNEFAAKENRALSDNPSPQKIVEGRLEDKLSRMDTHAEALAKVNEMIEALGKSKPNHPNAEGREIASKALANMKQWLESDGVKESWGDTRADAIMGAGVILGAGVLVNIKKYNEQADSDIVGRFVDKIVAKYMVVEGNELNPEKLTQLKDYIFKDVAGQSDLDQAKSFVNEIKDIIGRLDKQHPNAATRSAFLDALDDFSKPFTTLKGVMEYTKNEYKSELPKQIEVPGTFFRSNSSFTKGLLNVFKADSPKMLERMNTETEKLMANVKKDFPELYKQAMKGEKVQVDIGGGQTQEVPAIQLLALKLAHKLFDNVCGSNPQENRGFVDLMGDESRIMIRDFSRDIKNLEGKEVGKQKHVLTNTEVKTAEKSFNSNNIVLRGLGAEIQNQRSQLGKDSPVESELMKLLSSVLTSAAGDVKLNEKADTHYRVLPEYDNLMIKMQTTIQNIVDVHIPQSLQK